MADMQFETNPDEFGRPPARESGFDLSGKLIEWGMVSNRTEAQYVLGAIAVLAIVAAFFFYRSGSADARPSVWVDSSAETVQN